MARKKKQAEEPKPEEAKQREPETTWNEGKPERPGLYDCIVNGERKTLQLKKCYFTKRIYWMNIDGTDVDQNADVKWHEGNVFLE